MGKGRGGIFPGEGWIHICLCVTIFIFFCAGLPMWLVGCNPDVPNGCMTRSIEDANVTTVKVESGVCCSSCKCGKSTCCCGGYSCYSTKVGLDTPHGYCESKVDGVFRDYDYAVRAGERVGNSTQVVIDPRTKLCTIYLRESWNVWVAGMFFMCLTACCCLCWYIYCCSACIEDGCDGCKSIANSCDCCEDGGSCPVPKFPDCGCCFPKKNSWVSRQNTRFHTTMRQGTVRLMNIRKKGQGEGGGEGEDKNQNNNNNNNTFVELEETRSGAISISNINDNNNNNPTNTTSNSNLPVTSEEVPPPYDGSSDAPPPYEGEPGREPGGGR